jgi:hypothetical protein
LHAGVDPIRRLELALEEKIPNTASVVMNEFTPAPGVTVPTIMPSRTANFASPPSCFQPLRVLPSKSSTQVSFAAAEAAPASRLSAKRERFETERRVVFIAGLLSG